MKRLVISRPTKGEGRFIKQSGPIGRFAHVILIVESTFGSRIEFSWAAPQSSIPPEFRGSVERGVQRLFKDDARFTGFSPVGLLVRVVGGTFHPTDSNEISFELAASAAFIDAVDAYSASSDI